MNNPEYHPDYIIHVIQDLNRRQHVKLNRLMAQNTWIVLEIIGEIVLTPY